MVRWPRKEATDLWPSFVTRLLTSTLPIRSRNSRSCRRRRRARKKCSRPRERHPRWCQKYGRCGRSRRFEKTVAVERCGAIHIDVSLVDAVERARHARGQGVVNRIRIPLPLARALVHQSLNPGHDRRRQGSPAETGPAAGRPGARKSGETRWVGKTNHRIVSPDGVVRSEHGKVGDVAHSVVGDAGESGLPRGLGVSLTGAASDPVG